MEYGKKKREMGKMRGRKYLISFSVFYLSFVIGHWTLSAEEVHLKNGDRITGTILSYTQEEVILKTPYGILNIPKVNVVRISMEGEEDTLIESKPDEEFQEETRDGAEKKVEKEIAEIELPKVESPLLLPKPSSPKSTTTAMIYNVLPGGGYLYLGKTGKGLLTLVGESGLAIWGISLMNEDKKNIGIPLLIGVGLLRIIDFVDVIEKARATQKK